MNFFAAWRADNGTMIELDRATITIRSCDDPQRQAIAVVSDPHILSQIGARLQAISDERLKTESTVFPCP